MARSNPIHQHVQVTGSPRHESHRVCSSFDLFKWLRSVKMCMDKVCLELHHITIYSHGGAVPRVQSNQHWKCVSVLCFEPRGREVKTCEFNRVKKKGKRKRDAYNTTDPHIHSKRKKEKKNEKKFCFGMLALMCCVCVCVKKNLDRCPSRWRKNERLKREERGKDGRL